MKSPLANKYLYSSVGVRIHDDGGIPTYPLTAVGNIITFKTYVTVESGVAPSSFASFSNHIGQRFDYGAHKWLKVLDWKGSTPINGESPKLVILSALILYGTGFHPDGDKGSLDEFIEYRLTSFNNDLDANGPEIYSATGLSNQPRAIEMSPSSSGRLLLDGGLGPSQRNILAIDVKNTGVGALSGNGRFSLIVRAQEFLDG